MSQNGDGMKLLISYNIDIENAREYYEFALGQYIPMMQSLGLELSEAWHTAYGDYPNRLIGFVARDAKVMKEVMHGETWIDLNDKLLEFVTDLDYKVIPYSLGFQF